MLDNDIVAIRQANGHYLIRRWRSVDSALVPIEGYGNLYKQADMYKALDALRSDGDTWVRDEGDQFRIVESSGV